MRSPFGAVIQLNAARVLDPTGFPANAPALWPSAAFQQRLRDPKLGEQLASYRNTVFKAINFKANQVMQLSRGVVRISTQERPNPFDPANPLIEVTRRPVPEHPVTQMLAKGSQGSPNPWTTSGNFVSTIVIDLSLTGNFYALKVRDSEGVPRWLIRLRPDWVKLVPDPTIGVGAFAYRPGGGEATTPMFFAPSEIIHIKQPSPIDDRVGWSTLRSMAYAADLGDEIRRYQWQFFEQGARIDGVITGAVNDEQVDQAYDLMIASAHKGTESAWLPLVMPAGLKWEPTQATAKDFEFAALANFSENDILEAYGVPRGLLGNAEKIPYSNLQTLMVISADNGIKPLLRTTEEHIEACLLQRDFAESSDLKEGESEEFVFEDPKPADPEETRLMQETDLKTAVRTINQVREERGLAPVPWGDVPLVPPGLAPLDQLIDDGTGGTEDDDLPPFG